MAIIQRAYWLLGGCQPQGGPLDFLEGLVVAQKGASGEWDWRLSESERRTLSMRAALQLGTIVSKLGDTLIYVGGAIQKEHENWTWFMQLGLGRRVSW